MTETMASASVISRIKKLLALADQAKNSSEAEAQAAALKVQEMLQDYGLTMSQIEESGEKNNDPLAEREAQKPDAVKAMYEWQQKLMATIAEGLFCFHAIRRSEEKRTDKSGLTRMRHRHYLVGRRINVDVAISTYLYLEKTVKRIAEEKGFGAKDRKSYNLFIEGAVSRLKERLDERRYEREAQSAKEAEEARRRSGSTGTSLVLSDVYGSEADLNNDLLNGFPAGTTAARRRDREAKEIAREAREKGLIEQGVERTEAFYLSHGYSAETAKAYAKKWNNRQNHRFSRGHNVHRGWTRADEKHHLKITSAAYKSGRDAGNDIGLDTQVGNTKRKAIT